MGLTISFSDLSAFKATREGYGDALMELGLARDDVVVLDGDLSKSTGSWRFGSEYPSRFINCGIAEQSMMGTAAGLAASGKVCYTGSFAIFATGRAFEQIRNTISYCDLDVKICPTHSGVTVGEDGGSHQSIEDIALMRSIPNMKVLVPADYFEAREMVKSSASLAGPVYIRLGRPKIPKIYNDDHVFRFQRADVLRTGDDITILAIGIMVSESLRAANDLSEKGIEAEVINVSTLKPLDEETILRSVGKTGFVLTAEEHSVIGGLGGAVCELLGEKMPTKLVRVGVKDRFGTSGKPDELMVHFNLTSTDICEAAEQLISSQ